MDIDADLTIALSDFGIDATLNGATLRGLPRREAAVAGVAPYGAAATDTTFLALASAVPATTFGKALVLPSGPYAGNYTVQHAAPAGYGLVRLTLAKAAA